MTIKILNSAIKGMKRTLVSLLFFTPIMVGAQYVPDNDWSNQVYPTWEQNKAQQINNDNLTLATCLLFIQNIDLNNNAETINDINTFLEQNNLKTAAACRKKAKQLKNTDQSNVQSGDFNPFQYLDSERLKNRWAYILPTKTIDLKTQINLIAWSNSKKLDDFELQEKIIFVLNLLLKTATNQSLHYWEIKEYESFKKCLNGKLFKSLDTLINCVAPLTNFHDKQTAQILLTHGQYQLLIDSNATLEKLIKQGTIQALDNAAEKVIVFCAEDITKEQVETWIEELKDNNIDARDKMLLYFALTSFKNEADTSQGVKTALEEISTNNTELLEKNVPTNEEVTQKITILYEQNVTKTASIQILKEAFEIFKKELPSKLPNTSNSKEEEEDDDDDEVTIEEYSSEDDKVDSEDETLKSSHSTTDINQHESEIGTSDNSKASLFTWQKAVIGVGVLGIAGYLTYRYLNKTGSTVKTSSLPNTAIKQIMGTATTPKLATR